MRIKIVLSIAILTASLIGLYLVAPPKGQLYQDQNSYTIVWRYEWLGLTLSQDTMLETDLWDEKSSNFLPGFSSIFQDNKVMPGQSFFVKKGNRCFTIQIEKIAEDTVLYNIAGDGLSRTIESIDGILLVGDFSIGTIIRKNGDGELLVVASSPFEEDDDAVWFSFSSPREGQLKLSECDDRDFIRYPWETSNDWLMKMDRG